MRRCLICNRWPDDLLHGQGRDELVNGVYIEPRIEQHRYDSGERRRGPRRQADMSEQRTYTCDVPGCGQLATERLMSQGLLSGDGGIELAPFPLGDFCAHHWLLVHPALYDGLRGWRIEEEAA